MKHCRFIKQNRSPVLIKSSQTGLLGAQPHGPQTAAGSNQRSTQHRLKCGGTGETIRNDKKSRTQLDPDLMTLELGRRTTEDSKRGQHSQATDVCRWRRGVGSGSGSGEKQALVGEKQKEGWTCCLLGAPVWNELVWTENFRLTSKHKESLIWPLQLLPGEGR